jgi:hypothetical protein
MPRRVLGQISGNITNRKETSPFTRGLVQGKYEAGMNPSQISRDFQILRTTVNGIIQQILYRNNGESSS